MLYDFDTVINRWQTDSEKYDGLQKFAPGAPANSIPLWIADMDFKTAPEIIKAMHRRVEQGVFGYSDIYTDAYYNSVCGWMKKRHDWHVNPEEIIADSGVVPAIFHSLTLTAKPGDGVIIHTPAYKPFFDSIKKAGLKPVYSKLLKIQGRYEIDFEDFEEKAKDKKNTVLLFCSPHNPTGRVWSEEELTQMMDLCKRNGLTVISDEIHCDILRQGIHFTPIAKLFPDERGIITCTSPSKTFNLAGNHLANIIIPDSSLREQWTKKFHYMPNPISIEAVKVAYETCGDWLDELNRYVDETFIMMDKYFRENLSNISFHIPEATYLAWIYMGRYGLTHKDMVDLYIQNGLIIEGGEKFVANGSDYIRMNVAMPHSIIEAVLEKIKYIFN